MVFSNILTFFWSRDLESYLGLSIPTSHKVPGRKICSKKAKENATSLLTGHHPQHQCRIP